MAEENKEGRPLKFESAEELQVKIDEYFRECDERTQKVYTKDGDEIDIPNQRPYTISGLALHLGTSRQTLINYQNRDEFFDTIRAAKTRIEAFAEESLWTPKIASGVIFNLTNNFGWVNKQEVDAKNVNLNTDLTQLSPTERRARIDELNRRRGNGASDTS